MQVAGQNIQSNITSNNFGSENCSQCTCAKMTEKVKCATPQNESTTCTTGYLPIQNSTCPPQTVQIPASSSGVNIQIFNPSVGTPGAAPTYNVNAPCYPSNYYTGSVNKDGKLVPNTQNPPNDHNGDNINNGTNNGTIGDHNGNTTTTINNNNNSSTTSDSTKKTEKRKIVELTDEYIKNLENYLNSQDKEVRLNAAKEVYARLEEDDSRYDDKALNALINKMLQDPSQEVRFIALSALDGRIVSGDDYTVGLLKNIQNNHTSGFGQDAVDASNILLKMSGKQVEKEFEVKENKKKTTVAKTEKTNSKG